MDLIEITALFIMGIMIPGSPVILTGRAHISLKSGKKLFLSTKQGIVKFKRYFAAFVLRSSLGHTSILNQI
jgi:hypothetical protein